MSDDTDLNTQIAQRLFGWRPMASPWGAWLTAAGQPAADPPAYSTDPAATAQVWHWLEAHPAGLLSVTCSYGWTAPTVVCCTLLLTTGPGAATGFGATWPEALCRAALALADARETP